MPKTGKIPDPKVLTGDDIHDTTTEFFSKYSNVDSMTEGERDMMLLNKASGTAITDAFGVKEMAVEIERAVEQVEKGLKTQIPDTQSSGKKY